MLVGFGVTLVSTIVPALRASEHPADRCDAAGDLAQQPGVATRRWIIGGVLTVVGVVLYVVGILAKPGGTVADAS